MKRMLLFTLLALTACTVAEKKEMKGKIKLITLDPGHFHAALIQKSVLRQVDSTVFIYAPNGPEVEGHLKRITIYNTRPEAPTHWNEQTYLGPDFLERMISDKPGNVVIIAGNNQKKTEYIKKSISAGFNVLADKPMAINKANFELLKAAFEDATRKKLLLYDIMTERYEITNRLQRALSLLPKLFGTLERGTRDDPAVTKESVHHFYKYVSGQVLVRPSWFMDVTQQGEGLTDITTHLVDLVQWECFPEQSLDYTKDIQILSATRWSTEMTRGQFNTITGQKSFPDFLKKDVVHDSLLGVFANGEINYQIRGVNARVSVKWAYRAPEGTGDTHHSVMRGTRARLIIRQGAEQQFRPTLYIEATGLKDISFEKDMTAQFKKIEEGFPGVSLKKISTRWEVVIPERYKEGHEAHFAMVTEKFLNYLDKGTMPSWEIPNMIAKYYTTTTALDHAKTITSKK